MRERWLSVETEPVRRIEEGVPIYSRGRLEVVLPRLCWSGNIGTPILLGQLRRSGCSCGYISTAFVSP